MDLDSGSVTWNDHEPHWWWSGPGPLLSLWEQLHLKIYLSSWTGVHVAVFVYVERGGLIRDLKKFILGKCTLKIKNKFEMNPCTGQNLVPKSKDEMAKLQRKRGAFKSVPARGKPSGDPSFQIGREFYLFSASCLGNVYRAAKSKMAKSSRLFWETE